MQGSLINSCKVPQVNAGTFRFDLTSQKLSSAMMIVRVSAGSSTAVFRYAPHSTRFNDVNQGTALSGLTRSAAAAALDELSVTALGYKSKKVEVSSYETTLNVTLEAEYTGTCIASQKHSSAKGTGPHNVVIETNSGNGIKEGTIFRPEDLGPGKNYPIFVWGQGACSRDGLGAAAAMTEIASHGYFVIADGTPNNTLPVRNMSLATMTIPGLAYVTWAIAENKKPCSAYYQSLDTSKVAGNGFSCGGYLGQGLAGDPRTTTWGVTSSGSMGKAPDLWKSTHTPVLILEGSKDVSGPPNNGTGAYTNGLGDYDGLNALGKPVYFISNKNMGHGGDLFNSPNGGQFTKINLAWLNWWLKGDTGATGKGVLMGSTCKYCTDSNWEVKSANIQ